jgi:hypothetical protein
MDAEEPFLHAQILVHFDKQRAIDMILAYQKDHGAKGPPDYGQLLRDHVTKLCLHRRLDYNHLMHAARQRDFSALPPPEASSSTSETSPRSPPLRQLQQPQPVPFHAPSPPMTVRSGNSETRSSAEFIRIIDPFNSKKEHRLTMRYSGLQFSFISEKVLALFDACTIEECGQLQEPHHEATGREKLFITNRYIKLIWYRHQSDDWSTEGPDTFYIVKNLDSVAVLLGLSPLRQSLDRPESGSYPVLGSPLLKRG